LPLAANPAARLAFEAVSMDLPIAATVSAYKPGDGIAILVGRAAEHAGPRAISLPDIQECERLASSLGSGHYSPVEHSIPRKNLPAGSVLALLVTGSRHWQQRVSRPVWLMRAFLRSCRKMSEDQQEGRKRHRSSN